MYTEWKGEGGVSLYRTTPMLEARSVARDGLPHRILILFTQCVTIPSSNNPLPMRSVR